TFWFPKRGGGGGVCAAGLPRRCHRARAEVAQANVGNRRSRTVGKAFPNLDRAARAASAQGLRREPCGRLGTAVVGAKLVGPSRAIRDRASDNGAITRPRSY